MRWIQRILWIFFLLNFLGVLSITGLYFGAPWWLQQNVPRELENILGRPVVLQQVRVEPADLRLTLGGLAIAEENSEEVFAYFREISVQLSWESWEQQALLISAVTLQDPYVNVRYLGDQQFNFSDLVSQFAQPQPDNASPTQMPPVAVRNITVTNGTLMLEDTTRELTHELSGLNFQLPELANLQLQTTPATPTLEAKINQATLRVTGTSLPFGDSKETQIDVQVSNLSLPTYQRYLPATLPLQLSEGVIDANLQINYQAAPTETLEITGTIQGKRIHLQTSQPGSPATDLFKAEQLQTSEFVLRLLPEPDLALSRLQVTRPELWLHRQQDGTWSWDAFSNAAQPKPSVEAAPTFQFALEQLDLQDGILNVRDEAVAGGFAQRLEAIHLRSQNITWPPQDSLSLQLSANATSPKKTRLELESNVSVANGVVAGKLHLQQVPLATYAPYYQEQLPLQLEGVADLRLTFAWELASLPKLRDLRLELATARLTRDDQAWFSTESLKVRATEVDLVNRQIKLETISLNQPQALLTIAQNGVTNWQSLFPPNEAPSSTDSPNWEISLAEFQWNQGSLQLEHALPNATVNHGISQLNIALANVQYPLSGTTATRVQLQTEQGESVTLNGHLRWRSQAWEGQVQASANLTNWAPYFEDSLPAQLLSGRAKAGAEVSIGWGEPYVQIQQGTLALQNLRLQEPFATEPAIQLADIRAQQIDLAWPQNQLQLDELLLQDGTIRTVRYEDGSLNWQRWMAPKSEAQSEEPHNNAAAPWDVRLNQGRLQDLTFTWQDTTTAAQPLAFQDTQVEVQQLQTRTSSIDNLMLQGALGKTLVRLSGNTRWDAASDLSLDIQNVDLTEWQHLWQSAWPLTFARGAVDVLGRLQIRHDLEKEWLRFDGRLAAQQGVLQVAATGQEMARWQTLQVPQFNLTLEPFQLDTGAVEVDQLVLPLRRLPDESLQWVTLFEPATQEPASTAAPARVNPVVIEQIILRDAHLRWEDQSTDPNVALSLQNIHSRVQNVLGTPAPLQVHLKADWEGVAPISTNFELDWNREPWSVTGTLQTQDFDLLWINPYAQRFLGYQIQRGQLALDLDYQTKGDELQALNKIALNKPVLGRATPNPDAIDAPLQTALSLLRDTRGNVQLDVPVSGRLNDPQFDLSDATGQVLLGLIGSAVSAPFTLLVDAVLDTSLDDNTQQVRFPPGSLEVPEAEQNKLQQLRDVLGEHPEIRMELATLLVPDKEQSALRERELERLLRLEKAAQGIRAGNPVKAEGLTLSAKDRDDLLWVLYRRRVAKEMDLSPEQARSALLNTIRVPEEDLKALALQRAYNVRNLLLGKGFVSAEQIRLTSQVQILNDSQQSSRVELRLRR